MSKTVATAVAAAVVTMTLVAAPAFADRVDQRQANQANRIEQGLRNGSLTRQEASRLKAEQERIRELERQAERDGKLTREERARLEAAQDRASRNIYNEKHDGDGRWSNWRRWGGWGGYHRHAHEERRWYRRWW